MKFIISISFPFYCLFYLPRSLTNLVPFLGSIQAEERVFRRARRPTNKKPLEKGWGEDVLNSGIVLEVGRATFTIPVIGRI